MSCISFQVKSYINRYKRTIEVIHSADTRGIAVRFVSGISILCIMCYQGQQAREVEGGWAVRVSPNRMVGFRAASCFTVGFNSSKGYI